MCYLYFQWSGWLPYFMIYRFVSAVALVTWFVWDLYMETSAFTLVLIPHTRDHYEFYFLFAVNWCFLLVATSAFLHCCLCTFRVITRKSKKEGTVEGLETSIVAFVTSSPPSLQSQQPCSNV